MNMFGYDGQLQCAQYIREGITGILGGMTVAAALVPDLTGDSPPPLL